MTRALAFIHDAAGARRHTGRGDAAGDRGAGFWALVRRSNHAVALTGDGVIPVGCRSLREKDPVALASNLGEVAHARLRRIRHESEPVTGHSRWTVAGRRGRRRRDDLDRRAVLEVISAKCVRAIGMGSSLGGTAPVHPKRVDDGVHFAYRVVGVKRVGDGEGVEDQHVAQVK